MVADMAVVTTTTLVVTMVAMLLMVTVLLTATALLTVLLLTAHILLRRLRLLRLRLRHLLPGNKPVYTTGAKKRGLFEPPFLMTSKKGLGLSAWRIIQVGLTEHRTHTAYQFQ